MLIIPAIDLINGQCVRLKQGNYNQKTTYSSQPIKVAKKWQQSGAKMLHVVDLDGAKSGKLVNFKTIRQIIQTVKIPVQVGGGIQSLSAVTKLLECGASRVILGTIAVENQTLMQKIINKYQNQVVVSLDSKRGKLATRGWLKESQFKLIDSARKMEKIGIKRLIYTNILRDGTLNEPDYKEIDSLINSVNIPLIIAGAVSSLKTIKQLKKMQVEAAIVGKALYEGKVNLKEAINIS